MRRNADLREKPISILLYYKEKKYIIREKSLKDKLRIKGKQRKNERFIELL